MTKLFEGIKVLDFTSNIAGPNATALLADFGAEVIKIEQPGVGDSNRAYAPFIEGVSINGAWYNRGKKSVALDAKHPKAVEILRELAKQADVIVESFRPGVIAKMGFGYEAVVQYNPRVIMCSVSAFGQSGPYSQKPGYDFIAQAMSGLMSLTGYPESGPLKMATTMGDFIGSYNAFGAISAALYHRERTGEGQYIDIALLDSLMVANDHAEAAFNGFRVGRTGNHNPNIAPFGVYHGSDGDIVIAAVSEKLWAELCRLMGKEELINDPGYNSSGKRATIRDKVIPIVEGWLQTFKTIDEAKQVLDDKGIPCAKIYSMTDVMNDPHIKAREMITELAVPNIPQGKIIARGSALKFSKFRATIGAAPQLGQHTEEVLARELGFEPGVMRELAEQGVFGAKK